MKKFLVLITVLLLSGCSTWSSWNFDWDWNWSNLNPWSSEENIEGEAATKPEISLPENVNKYLWQAALDKLIFMGIESQNTQEGRIITKWATPVGYSGERFKIVAEINDGELRADALNVKVYKEIKTSNGWSKASPSPTFRSSIEQEIVKQAKILYINDKNKD